MIEISGGRISDPRSKAPRIRLPYPGIPEILWDRRECIRKGKEQALAERIDRKRKPLTTGTLANGC